MHSIGIQNRNKKPAQVKAIEELLKQKKGLLLTKLLEASNSNRQAIKALEKAKFITLQKLKIDRSPIAQAEYFITKPKLLNEAQKAALEKISSSIAQGSFAVHLLFGVTGSGKTEVYLQAIRQALDKEKQVLMLVPEIALTNQTIERFKSRFKERISILHHRLSPGERNDEWHKINSGQTSIVIGARSAIFSPLQNIGLIIVDEEHEQSFKQSDFTPRYSGKDVAIFRAKLCQATIILGSATPSLESFYNAETHKYTLSILSARAKAQQLPKVKIVDMLAERENKHCSANFSTYLLDAITDRLKKNEQIILFLKQSVKKS